MNKLNNNEALQMTTVMPMMKKSLLALAVAGTMAMSGGAYADTSVVATSAAVYTAVAAGTDTVTVTLAGTDTVIVAGVGATTTVTSAKSATFTATITDTGTATSITVNDGGSDGVTIGTIDMALGDTVTISTSDTTNNVALTIGAVTTTNNSVDGTLVITGVNATGTKDIAVTATDIGTSANDLAALNVIGSTTNASLTVTGDAVVATTTVTGTSTSVATLTLASNSTASNASLTGAIVLAGGTAVGDAVLVLGSATSGTLTTVTGGIDTVSGEFGTIQIADDATIIGNIISTGAGKILTTFTADKTLTMGANNLITDAVTTASAGSGTLTFSTSTNSTITLAASTIGAENMALKAVNVSTNSTSVATLTGAIYAKTLNVENKATGTNKVVFSGKITADLVNLDGAGNFRFDDDVIAAQVVISGTSTTTVDGGNIINGLVTNDSGAALGTLTFEDDNASLTLVSGSIGTSAATGLVALNATSGSGTKTFGGNVWATTINATATDGTGTDTVRFNGTVNATNVQVNGAGTVAFDQNITGNLDFDNGETLVTIAADKSISGAITTDVTTTGTITFANSATDTTVATTIGASSYLLTAVNLGANTGATATVSGIIHATNVLVNGAGTVHFGDAVNAGVNFDGEDTTITVAKNTQIAGAITTDVTNTGTLTYADATSTTTVAGSTIGVSGKLLKAVNLGASTGITVTATANHDIYATMVNVNGAGTVAFTGNVNAAVNFDGEDGFVTVEANDVITGAITTNVKGDGTITFATTTANATIASTIGAVNAELKAVVSSTSGGSTGAIFSGDIHATTVTTSNAAAGDSTQYSGTVNATTFNIDGTGAVALNGDVTATNVIISGDAEVTVAAGKKIIGIVSNDNASSGLGSLTFAPTISGTDNVLASANVGSSAKLLKLIEITVTDAANNANATATMAGNLYATTITSTATAKSANGTDAIAYKGTVDAGTFTFAGTGEHRFDNKVTTTSDLDIISGSNIVLTEGIVSGETVFYATQSGTAFASATADNVKVTMPQTFNSGSINFIDYDVVTPGTMGADDAAKLNLQNTVLNTFTAGVGSDASIVKITAVKKAASLIASELNITTSQASALDGAVTAVASGDASGLAAMQAILTTGVTQDNVEQLQPDVGAANGASLVSVGATNNIIAGRQSNVKVAFNSLGNQSGVSTGDSANDLTVWAQIFGSNANQDKIGSIDGYDADSSGIAVGWETTKSDDLFGFSMSYADANVDGKSASASHTDSTAVQGSVYGTYNKATDWMVGYALADNDTSRLVNINGLNRTAAGKYDSGIMSAKIGHTFESTGSFVPKVDASWTHVNNDGYTETGADNLGLVVGDSDHDVITLRAGGEYSSTVNSGTTRFSVMGGYDVVNDNVETTSTFIGGGSAFTTKGADPEKVSLQLGFGYDLVSDDSTVSIDLGTDVRDAYDNTTASITLKSKF